MEREDKQELGIIIGWLVKLGVIKLFRMVEKVGKLESGLIMV